jgi:hypothetical protein
VAVRSNHVHIVVSADCPPERVMIDLKAYATRALRRDGDMDRSIKIWEDHGSTRYLWTPVHLQDACAYVLDGQGGDLPEM